MWTAPYSVVDMTYDPETGKLYAAMEAYNISPIVDSFKAIIAEVDPATGAIKEQIMKDSVARPSNLLFHDGKLYFVDGFTAGMLTSIDLEGRDLLCSRRFSPNTGAISLAVAAL